MQGTNQLGQDMNSKANKARQTTLHIVIDAGWPSSKL